MKKFFQLLFEAFIKKEGRKPNNLEMILLKREAMKKSIDERKILDLRGDVLDPNKPILGGTQSGTKLDKEFAAGIIRATKLKPTEVKKVDLSKYDDAALNALVREDIELLREANNLSEAGKNYGRVKEIEVRRKEIREIIEAAQDVPPSGYDNFKADLAAEKQIKTKLDKQNKESIKRFKDKMKDKDPEDLAGGGIAGMLGERTGFQGGGADMGTVHGDTRRATAKSVQVSPTGRVTTSTTRGPDPVDDRASSDQNAAHMIAMAKARRPKRTIPEKIGGGINKVLDNPWVRAYAAWGTGGMSEKIRQAIITKRLYESHVDDEATEEEIRNIPVFGGIVSQFAGGGIAGMLGEPTYMDENHRVPLKKGKTPKYKKDPIDWWDLIGDELDPDEWEAIKKSVGAYQAGGRVPFKKGRLAFLEGIGKLMDEFFPGTTKFGQRSKPFPGKVQEKMDLRKALAEFRKREEAAKSKITAHSGDVEKAGEGRFTKAEVLNQMFENTIKQSKSAKDKKMFTNFAEEIKNKPELANDPKVWNFFTGKLPKNQKLVVYGDDTVDFWRQSDFGPHNIQTTDKFMKKHPNLSREQAIKIQNMEPEDQIFEMKKIEALRKKSMNAEGGIIGRVPYWKGGTWNMIKEAIKHNKIFGLGGPPYKPGATSFDIKKLTKDRFGSELSLQDLKELAGKNKELGRWTKDVLGKEEKFPDFITGFKEYKADVIKQQLLNSKQEAQLRLKLAKEMLEGGGPKEVDQAMKTKIGNQMVRESKQRLEDLNKALKDIDIYKAMKEKTGVSSHASGGLARMLGE